MKTRRPRLSARPSLSMAPATLLLMALAGLGEVSPALGNIAVANGPETLTIPDWPGDQVLKVELPDAAISSASKLVPGALFAAEERGFTVGSRIILNADDPAGAKTIAAAEGVELQPYPGLPGFWIADAGTIRKAVRTTRAFQKAGGVKAAYLPVRRPDPLRDLPTDPGFEFQWHLLNTVNSVTDINIEDAWAMGYTGAGITVAVVEDGFFGGQSGTLPAHPDLVGKYNPAASQPYFGIVSRHHGTAVAGLIAASANNAQGGVGVAYGAMLADIDRLMGLNTYGPAFLFANDLNAIKNNSYGPQDDNTITIMRPDERAALANSVANGRDGRGTIFVWAAGNGGQVGDRCDYDPYASSRYTIAVGAYDETDRRSYLNETGSSMMIVAPSNGTAPARGIYTTWGAAGYTSTFGGTSAAAPIVAGVIALMLEARPELTWRDVQHILIDTARQLDPVDGGWTINGGGRAVSYHYGFGAVDAAAAVSAAQTWPLVSPEISATSGPLAVGTAIPNGSPAGVVRTYTMPERLVVESVEVTLNIPHERIGDLQIVLTSPSGMQSVFAVPREDPWINYTNYIFTSVRHWGELSDGEWSLAVADMNANSRTGTWSDWTLTVHGTAVPPACPADFNADRAVDAGDLTAYLTAWFADRTNGTLVADWNEDAAVNASDITAYLTQWFADRATGECGG